MHLSMLQCKGNASCQTADSRHPASANLEPDARADEVSGAVAQELFDGLSG